MPAPDDFMTVAEVASILKLNQQPVRSWIDQENLPALHIGRRVRARRTDFDACQRRRAQLVAKALRQAESEKNPGKPVYAKPATAVMLAPPARRSLAKPKGGSDVKRFFGVCLVVLSGVVSFRSFNRFLRTADLFDEY